mgnify:CR=1 FL=1
MKLIIDAGNTTIKVAVFEGDSLLIKQAIWAFDFKNGLKKIIDQYPKVNNVIISSVSNIEISELDGVLKNVMVTTLSHETKVPFKNLYRTPASLGVDRIALVTSAVCQFPKKNCLVIDVGSCITYDFVNSKKEYYGGAIGPGLQMRYKSLNQFTANLPLLRPKYVDSFEGDSTENAIHAGVSLAIETEILGVIDHFSNKYPKLVVILTGGDADFLSKRLKNGIFVLPNFLIKGLSHILDYNTNK